MVPARFEFLCTAVCLATAIMTATLVFLNGFLPLKKSIPGFASHGDFPYEPVQAGFSCHPKFDRLVVMLVDALRSDFVFVQDRVDSAAMPFIQQLMHQRQMLMVTASAHPPTVTMPRIKAITSGDIPGFVDVMMNLNSKALHSDNIVSQLHRIGKNIVFYGDETWLSLFPDHFIRHEGTTSFFVSDYTEVDDNVTRCAREELLRHDWDVMILHYLGLDHIGHLEGPASKLVVPKLREMDEVFATIYSAVMQQDQATGRSTVLLLCGDHGMSDVGSHGGATSAETRTPFLLAGMHFNDIDIGHHSLERYQIDIVPTLSILLGLPIPRGSLGVLIPEALGMLSARDKLSASFVNCQQLLAVLQANLEGIHTESMQAKLRHAVDAHISWLSANLSSNDALADRVLVRYQAVAHELQSLCATALVHYDLPAMLYGSATFFLALLIFGTSVIENIAARESKKATLPVVRCSLLSVAGATCCIGSGTALQLTCTSASWRGSSLCISTAATLYFSLLFGTLSVTALSDVVRCFRHVLVPASRFVSGKNGKKNLSCGSKLLQRSRPLLSWLLLAGTALHSFSYLSSSFVEEEQQTWYYLSATALFVLLLTVLRTAARSGIRDKDLTAVLASRGWRASWRVAAALTLARLIRNWNQTGDKWAHLPDIGDWLRRSESTAFLLLVVLGSLLYLAWWALSEAGRAQSVLFLCGLLVIGTNLITEVTASKAPTVGSGSHPSSFWGLVMTRLSFALCVGCAAMSLLPGLSLLIAPGQGCSQTQSSNCELHSSAELSHRRVLVSCRQAWVLLAAILHKPHNIPLMAMLALQERLLASAVVCLNACVDVDSTDVTLLYAWLGQAGYFAQGNSNSIASLDVGAGYKGSVDYNPVVVGSLMMSVTFSSQVFWLLSLLQLLVARAGMQTKDFGSRYSRALMIASQLYWSERCLSMAVYTALIIHERYHLFIWSVFAPKLLYESVFTALCVALCSVLSTVSCFAVAHFPS